MFTLHKALIQEKIASASTIKVLDRASVPIVKFTEQSTNVKVRTLVSRFPILDRDASYRKSLDTDTSYLNSRWTYHSTRKTESSPLS